jgi:hypothetical protein
MQMAITGALVGLAVAVLMYSIDFTTLRSQAKERAKRQHKKDGFYEFDVSEQRRLNSVIRFCFFVPPAFALAAWMIWG